MSVLIGVPAGRVSTSRPRHWLSRPSKDKNMIISVANNAKSQRKALDAPFDATKIPPRAARPAPVDFDAINRRALSSIKAVLGRVLPGGRVESGEYVARNPRRSDKSLGSFKVNLRSGRWADFAEDDPTALRQPPRLATRLKPQNGYYEAGRPFAYHYSFRIDLSSSLCNRSLNN
jgi:hypothetical protein